MTPEQAWEEWAALNILEAKEHGENWEPPSVEHAEAQEPWEDRVARFMAEDSWTPVDKAELYKEEADA